MRDNTSAKLAARGVRLLAVLFLCGSSVSAAKTYSVTGMVLKVDKTQQRFVASCQAIPGYMDAMVMSYSVHDSKELESLAPGALIEFTLVVNENSAFAENVHVRRYQSVEQDPLSANRLKLLDAVLDSAVPPAKALEPGQHVPEFVLTDQKRQRVAFSQFSGKVVLLNFVYTRCALPNFCLRIANNFGVLQRRFKMRMGKDLIFLTVTFDPDHDTPEALAQYAGIWKADPATWHFLTGAVPDVQRVCNLFGVVFFPDEGLMDHSLHTAIVDASGKLVANLEGNEFTADQLGDLVQTVLDRPQAQ
jgi:protein SCO1